MIAFNATRNVFMLMSDARQHEVQAAQRKPVHMPLNCAERRFIQWSRNSPSGDLETGFRNKKLSSFYKRYHFSVTQSAIRNWEEGRHSQRDHTAAILAQFLAERSKCRK
jgi:hypothetical protein